MNKFGMFCAISALAFGTVTAANAANEDFFAEKHQVLDQRSADGERLVQVTSKTGEVSIHQLPTPVADQAFAPYDIARPLANNDAGTGATR